MQNVESIQHGQTSANVIFADSQWVSKSSVAVALILSDNQARVLIRSLRQQCLKLYYNEHSPGQPLVITHGTQAKCLDFTMDGS
jgi:hypothetical protein